MADYHAARAELDEALNLAEPNGPEWIKLRAALAALWEARSAQIDRDFVRSSRRLEDTVLKLQALTASLSASPGSQVLARVRNALQQLQPVVDSAAALLGGEPASALPDMPAVNKPSFPTADEPSIAPVREYARDLAEPPASRGVAGMIDDILRREGGFVDHPDDRGGPTNFGITQRTLAQARGQPVTRDDVRRLRLEEARAIYEQRYFRGPRLAELPVPLQPVLFDMSINHGPGTAIKLLQRVLGASGFPCAVDGGIGDETLGCAQKALAQLGAGTLVDRLVDARRALFQAIVAADASQAVFLKGWLRRAEEFRTALA
jgi:lysozyme family protein